jgi:hypothetical protein
VSRYSTAYKATLAGASLLKARRCDFYWLENELFFFNILAISSNEVNR